MILSASHENIPWEGRLFHECPGIIFYTSQATVTNDQGFYQQVNIYRSLSNEHAQ
jgi:hypothetical protein